MHICGTEVELLTQYDAWYKNKHFNTLCIYNFKMQFTPNYKHVTIQTEIYCACDLNFLMKCSPWHLLFAVLQWMLVNNSSIMADKWRRRHYWAWTHPVLVQSLGHFSRAFSVQIIASVTTNVRIKSCCCYLEKFLKLVKESLFI